MREIKFRAWDKQNKIMLDNSLNGMNHNSWLLLLQLNTGNVWKKGFFNDDLTERMIVMQYTGLKDKNGKEIYEGDIVRINNLQETWKRGKPNFDWRIFSIEWVRYTFVLTNKAMNKPLADYDTRTLQPWDCEIIGNIYENPELLNRHC